MKIDSKKYLIGGQALTELGSSRKTLDVDYLVFLSDNDDLFIKDAENNVDYVNANAHDFYRELWEQEVGNISPAASPATLLNSKAFAFAQHCKNGFWQKADDAEYDIKYLVRHCGVRDISIAARHLESGAVKEIQKIIDSVR